MRGWRPALLIAWRDAVRHRARSALVLVMIALPVMAVTAAVITLKTSQVTAVEGADRLMGAGDALLHTDGSRPVRQAPDMQRSMGGGSAPPTSEAQVRAVLGEQTRLLPIRRGWAGVRLDDRVVDASYTGVDLRDPLARPLFDLTDGRLPEARDEVVVNDAFLEKGLSLGDEVELAGGTATIVGSGRDATSRTNPVLLGPAQAFETGSESGATWLVESGPVTWEEVLELNEVGALVTSRSVLADPPDQADVAPDMRDQPGSGGMIQVAALVVVMALIEVVLLAGPAFAVGARRQARTLALVAASGGTPVQARRVVLASGVVLGAVAAAAGLVLGVALGWAALPLTQQLTSGWFGPFEVPVLWTAAIAAFGLLSAFLASVVPAWIASRQDVVAVLAGRRGDRRPRVSTPVLGLVLLGIGIAGSTLGAVASSPGAAPLWIAGSAVVSVLGMIMVVPVVVAQVARLGRRLPLAMRYAVRDAARHRTRTVPAVAAVAATVAGVVALGIGNASDELENERTYQPEQAMGTGRVNWWPSVTPGEDMPAPDPVWDRLEAAVRDTAPDVEVSRVVGLPESLPDGGYTSWWFDVPGEPEGTLASSHSAQFSTSVLVGTESAALGVRAEEDPDQVDRALAAGKVVVFSSAPVDADEVVVRSETFDPDGNVAGSLDRMVLPAEYVVLDGGAAPAQALVPPEVPERLGAEPTTAGLFLDGDLDEDTQTRIAEAVAAVDTGTSVYVERGYQRSEDAVVVLLVLVALGGVLMLGGTLTATFLALSDARPDLATLSAVGASPRTRRAVAASYALVVGFVGALLGAGVGFIPGIAVSRPLTSLALGPAGSGPYLDVPWLLILTLVVALPLVTAAVVGLTARSRLPLVARLD